MIKNLYLLLLITFLSACSTISPVTWNERVEKTTSTPAKLHYKEQGSGEVLLLLHGFAESSFTWRYLVNDLAKNHRVISLDLKGFGESPKPKDGRYSIYDQAVAVKYFIRQHNINKVTLVGHSLGGGVALALTLMAEKEPWQVDRLVLIGAAGYKQNLPSMLADLNRPIIGRVGVYLISADYQARKGYEFAFYDDKKIPEEGVKESTKNFSRPGSRYVFLQAARQLIPQDIEKVSKQYRRIKQPVLIIWGKHDEVIPRYYARRLHKSLENSQLKIIPNAGHMPQEETPKKVLRFINQFMQMKFSDLMVETFA